MDYTQVLGQFLKRWEKITDESPLILITCSGVSNTGKLTAQVGGILAQKEPDLFEGHLHAKQSTRDMETVINGGKLVVIDGCGDCCAAKKLKSLCLTPHIHIIATEEGIEKNGMGTRSSKRLKRSSRLFAGKYGDNQAEGMNKKKKQMGQGEKMIDLLKAAEFSAIRPGQKRPDENRRFEHRDRRP